jgi:pimeloyl-ACP methyl ester carboxylesterase
VQQLSSADARSGALLAAVTGATLRTALPRIRKPALITHGANDAVVKPEVVDQHKAALAHAQIHIMPNVGHAAFWEDSLAFNQRLRTFVEMCSAVTTATPAIR